MASRASTVRICSRPKCVLWYAYACLLLGHCSVSLTAVALLSSQFRFKFFASSTLRARCRRRLDRSGRSPERTRATVTVTASRRHVLARARSTRQRSPRCMRCILLHMPWICPPRHNAFCHRASHEEKGENHCSAATWAGGVRHATYFRTVC